jgi:hypothetical protein
VDAMREDIRDGLPEHLAQLLRVGKVTGTWRRADLAEVLAHQLRVPLTLDLLRLGVAALGTPELGSEPWSFRTFGELLVHSAPPLSLLRLVKDFAKSSDFGAAALPTPVALVLYYAAIAAAFVRHGTSISSLEAEGLRDGINWVLNQEWLYSDMRTIFETALERLQGVEAPPNAP